MIDYQVRDEFYDKLPEITFDKDLALPLHTQKPPMWNERPVSNTEVRINSLFVDWNFPDGEGLLETAYDDFFRFMDCVGIEKADSGFFLRLKEQRLECFEAYKILVSRDGITVTSGDTEGIRRALIFIEDEMKRRAGSVLPLGEISRKPFIKDRISRCYFTPSSHAEIEEAENELCDDVDYYPDEYLNRLAHDGINALWLGASLRYLVKTPLVPEYGVDAEKRVQKLNSVVEKCRRYGIKVYLFAVDPASSYCNPHLLEHPELMDDIDGAKWRLLCPSQEKGIEYLKSAVKSLFTSVPHLAGYINLTVGEALSTCASDGPVLNCKRCKARFRTIGKTLAFVEKTIADAMHEVSPDAKYISWTYEQRIWEIEDLKESCFERDEKVIHLQNFEDFGRPLQLGKPRVSYDYWLSYIGPGRLFENTIAFNNEAKRKTYAKIQVCSSHEISTVPYVTAPGILYDKYKYFYENGIEGVMQCWFFGNYPCLMNKAAGELAFMPFFEAKDQFLEHLAGVYWGNDAKTVAKAWLLFEEGYRNFPVNGAFEWLGPMQDSPIAPLHLKPIDRSMPSTWLATDAVGGDRIGECMCNGHTHEEIEELVGMMDRSWSCGMRLLDAVEDHGYTDRKEQKSVAKATSLIFRSGYNIIRFYYLRRLLGIGSDDPNMLLSEMEEIAREEILNSAALIPICEGDNRIGYHSEAHGHKIFPEKLTARIEKLKELLSTEFVEVRERIEGGDAPLEFYSGIGSKVVYTVGRDEEISLVTRDNRKGQTRVKIEECDGGYKLYVLAKDLADDYIVIKPEFRIFHPLAPMLISKNEFIFPASRRSFFNFANSYRTFSIHPDDIAGELEKYSFTRDRTGDGDYVFTLYIDRERFGMEPGEPFRLDIERFEKGKHYDLGCTDAKEAFCFSDKLVTRLVHGTFSPECYAFIAPV